MFVVLNLCMVLSLVGDNCKDESAEKCEAEAGGQHDVARRKGGFEFGFGFVGHGFGFGGWNKRMCVGEAHPSVGLFEQKIKYILVWHNLKFLNFNLTSMKKSTRVSNLVLK